MSKYFEIYELTYVKNYGDDKDPLMMDLIHLSEYARDKLEDYVKAKVGYYLVPRLVIGGHHFKVRDFDNKDEFYDGNYRHIPRDLFYFEFYPPKHLGTKPPLVMDLSSSRRFYFDHTCLGNYLDVKFILKLKKYRYIYKSEIRKLLHEIEISIGLQWTNHIHGEESRFGLQVLRVLHEVCGDTS